MPNFVPIGQTNRQGDNNGRFFRFFKMAAVRCLGFVIRLFGSSTEHLVVFVTAQNLVGIGAVVMQVLIFRALGLGLKMSIGCLGAKWVNGKLFVLLSLY